MSDEMTDSKLATFTPAERAEIRDFAASILAAAQSDSEYPLGIDTVTNDYNGHDAFDAGDVRQVVYRLAREVEVLAKENGALAAARDEACEIADKELRINSKDLRPRARGLVKRIAELRKVGQ